MSGERILIVDDQASMRRSIARSLEAVGYVTMTAESVDDARGRLSGNEFDLVVCDLKMPGQSGLVLVKEIESGPDAIPVLMITAVDDPEVAHKAALLGANGYLVKPFSVNELRINVDQALEEGRRRSASVEIERDQLRRIEEVRDAMRQLEERARDTDHQAADLLRPLSEAVGRRDLETGAHIRRIGESSALLAEANGMTADEVESMRLAAPMHDVGKVAIPDSILLKPGVLDQDERDLMERHAEIGYDILTGSTSTLLDLAAEIALSHHEKFDGEGYPQGLEGDAIPLSGRIVAIADVYDALTSDRPYRVAMPQAEALAIMAAGRGSHFDPMLLDLFLTRIEEVDALAERYADKSDEDGAPSRAPMVRKEDETPDAGWESGCRAAAEAFGKALTGADGREAERIAFDCLRQGMGIETLYGEVLGPAMVWIGSMWESGEITVADEHVATAITHRVMASAVGSVSDRVRPRPDRVLLAAIAGQRHDLGLRMVADVLELAGFQVAFLGGDVPTNALLAAIETRKPGLIALSCTVGSAEPALDPIVSELNLCFPETPIVLGGQGVPDSLPEGDASVTINDFDGIADAVQGLIAA